MSSSRYRNPTGYLTAELLTAGSALASLAPGMAARILGDEQVDIRWRHARSQDVADVDDWKLFDGDPEAGTLPARFQKAVMLSIRASVLRARIRVHGGQPAVAYAAWDQVMVGLPRNGNQLFDGHPEDFQRLAIAMRIGAGPLQASMGHWDGERFTALTDKYIDAPIMPVAEMPVRVV